MRRLISLSLVASLVVANLYAQDPVDIFNISQTNYSMSTARSAAMGGAFTSLGADGASANINPAGIGMYKASDFSVTGSLLFNKAKSTTSGPLGDYFGEDSKVNAPLNNLTFVLPIYNSSTGVLRGANIGFVYSQTNNYRSSQYATGNYETSSIIDMYASQLNGIDPDLIYSGSSNDYAPYQDMPTSLWGAMMAYNSGLLYVSDGKSPLYSTSSDNGIDGTLFSGDEIYPELTVTTSGYKADYGFTAGFNILDRVYVGATLTALSYQYTTYSRYSEYANLDYNYGDLDIMDYGQNLTVNGSGVDFKFGITAELFEGLNVAAAVHTPSFYSISEEYYADMDSYYQNSPSHMYAGTPYLLSDYRVITPAKFLLGVSYNLYNMFIVSFDYDRTLYNKMRIDGLSESDDKAINDEIASTYKATNNYRVGVECRVMPSLYLRGGYAYYASPLIDGVDGSDSWSNISGGVGFKTSSFYCDLTYVNMQSTSSPQYYYSGSVDGVEYKSEQSYFNEFSRHSLMATLGFRF